MKEEDFNVVDFRKQLIDLEKELLAGVKRDPNYDGELEEILTSLKRLISDLKDPKFQNMIPDFLRVIHFLEIFNDTFSDLDDEDLDEEFDEDEEGEGDEYIIDFEKDEDSKKK